MNRRTLLTRGAGTLALTIPLAGCSGDSNGTEDGDDSDGTPTPSVGGSTGSVAENTVEGLDVVGLEEAESDDESQYRVTVTVKNVGEQETDAFDYNYELTVYDADGNDITGGSSGTTAFGADVAPDEEAELTVSTGIDGTVDDVARYEVTVNCDTFGEQGVYCQN